MLERVLSLEEVEKQSAAVLNMWEFAAVIDFLDLFRPQLRLRNPLTPDELVAAIVSSPGAEGSLAELHIVSSLPLLLPLRTLRPCLLKCCAEICGERALSLIMKVFTTSCSLISDSVRSRYTEDIAQCES